MAMQWVVPSSRALAKRPSVLGLPLMYASLLVTVCMMMALTLHYPIQALYLFLFGYGLGRVVTYYDPFAFDLMIRNQRLPKVMRP